MRKLTLLIVVGGALTACTPGPQSVIYSSRSGTSSVGSLGEAYTEFRGLAASEHDDVWGVGIDHMPNGDKPRIEHWNGLRWNDIPAAPNGGRPDAFNSVATASALDVWAVGYSAGVAGLEEATLIEHWNGRAWMVVASPNPGTVWNQLDSVVALSANDVWAVGYYKHYSTPARVLVEHWDGKNWSVVDAPNPGSGWNELASLSAVSASDLWGVGWIQDDGPRQPLVEHWNGVAWTRITINARSVQELRAVAAVSPTEVWASGPMGGAQEFERWDGTRWKSIPGPTPGQGVEIWGISASASDDAWVAGGGIGRGYQPLLEHWDGTSWKTVSAPGGIAAGRLTGVLSLSKNDAWIVGTRQANQPLTLIEHWDGSTWSVVDSAA
jgi:hypothetical protein